MAVIGAFGGSPTLSNLLSLNMLGLALLLLTGAGLAWLVADYARMLRLHRKMVGAAALMDKRKPY